MRDVVGEKNIGQAASFVQRRSVFSDSVGMTFWNSVPGLAKSHPLKSSLHAPEIAAAFPSARLKSEPHVHLTFTQRLFRHEDYQTYH